jgi:hypothetical protein
MNAHVGVDAEPGLMHTVAGTAVNVNDVTQADALLHGEQSNVFADAGYQGVEKRDETQDIAAEWHIAMRPKRRALDKESPWESCVMSSNGSKRGSVPRWNTRFASSSASSAHWRCAIAG